jgi:hypothetical protein
MEQFDAIAEKYHRAGISQDNLEYAVTAVKFGSNPTQILENLKVGYKNKNLNDDLANALLKDLFVANNHELKKKKRGILLFGTSYLLVGFVCLYYIFHTLLFGGVLHSPFFVILVAICSFSAGIVCFLKWIRLKNETSPQLR